MITFPNAKLNIGLNIVSKRKDGYHNIETVFYPIPLRDVLEIVPAGGDKTTFTQTGLLIEGQPEDNLVMKAYRLLAQDREPIDIYLRKHIPFGAGLGGGSADAAFMLKILNEYYQLNLSALQLEKYAAQLGADCPFFIQNQPVFAEGIGNVFTPVELSLSGYHIVLVKPDIHIPTPEAYAGVTPKAPEISIKDIIKLPVREWRGVLHNDFEDSIFPQYPEIKLIKDRLYDCGALYASMSGSGSSVYGIYEEAPEMEENLFPDAIASRPSVFSCLVPTLHSIYSTASADSLTLSTRRYYTS
jgi:4-diphosphocytidyl-2C-methyl-D-erythritol kinase